MDIQNIRHYLRKQLNSRFVWLFIGFLIIINSVVLGMETSKKLLTEYQSIFYLVDFVILSIFVVEIALRIFANGKHFFFSESNSLPSESERKKEGEKTSKKKTIQGWNIFDLIIVGFAFLSTVSFFSVFRILRILRILRLIRIVPGLRIVVEALLESIPGIGSIITLLLIFYYISAVITTRMLGADFPDHFGTLGTSMFTLFQIMTLESWATEVALPVMDKFPYFWIFFVVFILISTFTMLNLFIAIIVNTMQSIQRKKEKQEQGSTASLIETETAILQERLDEIKQELESLRQEVQQRNHQQQ